MSGSKFQSKYNLGDLVSHRTEPSTGHRLISGVLFDMGGGVMSEITNELNQHMPVNDFMAERNAIDIYVDQLEKENAALVKRWDGTKQRFIESFEGIGAAYLKAKKDGDESLCFTWQSVFINMQVLSYRVGKDQEFPHGDDDMEIQKDMIERSRKDFPASWVEHERQVKELQAGSK